MADRTFEILLKTPRGEGADLNIVIERLKALEALYTAVLSATARPGAGRAIVPRDAERFTKIRLVEASRKQSLGLVIQEPDSAPPDYDGDFYRLPEDGAKVFRKTLSAVQERQRSQLESLFPEKVDRVRILNNLEKLAPNPGEPAIVVRGLGAGISDIILSVQEREWIDAIKPTVTPERVEIAGMVKAGTLGASPRFKLFDGSRTVNLRPHADQLRFMRNLGGMHIISGTAHYSSTGVIEYIDDIDSIKQYAYETYFISFGETRFRLRHKLRFNAEASLEARGFSLNNDDLGIYVHSSSLKGAIDDVAAEFLFLWKEYVKVPLDQLHPSAIPLRRALESTIEQVEHTE